MLAGKNATFAILTEVGYINHKLSLNGDESLCIDFIVSINIVHTVLVFIFLCLFCGYLSSFFFRGFGFFFRGGRVGFPLPKGWGIK